MPDVIARDALGGRGLPTVKRRLAVAPLEVNKPHSLAIFNRGNGRFRCGCGRVHVWGHTSDGERCRALKCWCGHWHLRKDVTYTKGTP